MGALSTSNVSCDIPLISRLSDLLFTDTDLERPQNLSREAIESYRIPSILDFARTRLHTGNEAPNTYFVGRALKDSGEFGFDFIKVRLSQLSGRSKFTESRLTFHRSGGQHHVICSDSSFPARCRRMQSGHGWLEDVPDGCIHACARGSRSAQPQAILVSPY